MFHLAAFSESIDPGGNFNNLAAVRDERLFTQGDDIRVPTLNKIVMIDGLIDDTVNPSRARLYSPTLERYGRYEISPLDNEATGNSLIRVAPNDLRSNPITLGVDEILRAETNSNPGGAVQQTVLVWFADGPIAPVQGGETISVGAAAVGVAVANQWSLFSVTLDTNLPPGNYAIIGMAATGTDVVAARTVLRTGDQWRPGCMGAEGQIAQLHDHWRHGNMGQWGTFPFTQPPDVEVFADSAINNFRIVWDLLVL